MQVLGTIDMARVFVMIILEQLPERKRIKGKRIAGFISGITEIDVTVPVTEEKEQDSHTIRVKLAKNRAMPGGIGLRYRSMPSDARESTTRT